MGSQEHEGLLRPGDWGVMGKNGIVHVAETVDGLPRGRGICGAVGTAFVIREPLGKPLCERCAAAAAGAAR